VGRTGRLGRKGEAVLFLQPVRGAVRRRSSGTVLCPSRRGSCEGHLESLVHRLFPNSREPHSREGRLPKQKCTQQALEEGGQGVGRGVGVGRTGCTGGVEVREPPLCQEAQQMVERIVTRDVELHAMAGDAFRAFVRAYAAGKSGLRHIFHPKRLHLGHVARSFGLATPPTLLGKSGKKKALQKLKAHNYSRSTRPSRPQKRMRPAMMRE